MLPWTLQQRNTFLFGRLIIHQIKSTSFLTNDLQSSKSCLKWWTREFQVYSVTRNKLPKLNLSMKQHKRILNIFHQCLLIKAILKTLGEIETERLYGSTNDNNSRTCSCRSKPNYLTQCLVHKGIYKTSNSSFAFYGTSEEKFITTIQNRSDTVSAWMKLSYWNMCGT